VLSGVLQYLPDPWGTLRKLLGIRAPLVFLDRTALIDSASDRLTIQHVPASIYRVDHPVWFLSETTLAAILADAGYECLCDFPAIDRYTLPGADISFKGFICQTKR
jgi:putative methyltransferase (TIGR04325 family)